jgi:hypothetical protein
MLERTARLGVASRSPRCIAASSLTNCARAAHFSPHAYAAGRDRPLVRDDHPRTLPVNDRGDRMERLLSVAVDRAAITAVLVCAG